MIELIYSNKTETLLKNLALNLELKEEEKLHPLEPVEIIVPNRNMETWIRLGLAQLKGIAANINFKWLENYISDLVSIASRDRFKLVNYQVTEAAILAALLDEKLLEGKELNPVSNYLRKTGRYDALNTISLGFDSYLGADSTDIRRVQLAAKMSSLFQEYSFSRPEMISGWREKAVESGFEVKAANPFKDPGKAEPFIAETVSWQRALWLSVFGPDGVLEKNQPPGGGNWITIDQLAYDSSFFDLLKETVLPPVHIFGVSYMARIYQVLFARLGELGNMHIYTLNPCAEFWEDVETDREYINRLGRELYRRKKKMWTGMGEPDEDDPFGLFEADNPALRYWGRPGREHIRLLGELTDCDFYDAFSDPLETGTGLLHQLQKDILERNPERVVEDNFLEADGTINLVAAPSVRREVEWVADEIWNLMRSNGLQNSQVPLRFSDIAVIINSTEHERYLPQIETVFTACQNLPFTVSDLPGKAGSKMIEAIIQLLKLPFGRFTRAEMLAFMSHPAVITQFEYLTPEAMAAKADKLGIVYGSNHSDHEGTYIDEDVLNWNQGILRLALGAFMSGEKSGDNRIFEAEQGRWLVEESSGSLSGAAAQFGLLSRSLLTDCRFVRTAEMTLSSWATFFRAQAEKYLHAETTADTGDRLRIIKTLSKLENMDMGKIVSGRTASEIAFKLLDSLPGNRGRYLSEGVAVSSFLPMRAIPFKVVFVLGLGEGLFPATGRRDALDLRSAKRRTGDVDPSERDRYMFLETLLSTREKLYLSFVRRDELTGDPLQPSAVVQELLHMLKLGFMGPENLNGLFKELPLRRFDDPAVFDHSFLDEAKAEARIRELAKSLDDQLNPAGRDVLPGIWPFISTASQKKIEDMLLLPGKPPGTCTGTSSKELAFAGELNTESPVNLTISNLHNFLSCPMQGWASAVLGLSEAEEDLAEQEEEDFEFSPLAKTGLLREIFYLAAAEELEPAKIYDQKSERLRLAGQIPVGSLGRIYREHHLVILEGWLDLLNNNISPAGSTAGPDSGASRLERIRFGQTGRNLPATEIYDPILIELQNCNTLTPVRLSGTTEVLADKGSTTIILQPKEAPGKSFGKTALGKCSRHLLRGILDHIFLSAAERGSAAGRKILLLYADQEGKTGCLKLRLHPVAKDKALNWLTEIVSDMVYEPHAYLLPCEAVFQELRAGIKALTGENKKDFRTADIIDGRRLHKEIIGMAENSRLFFSSLWGPVPEPRSYCPPDADIIAELVAERMGLIFEGIIEVEDLR